MDKIYDFVKYSNYGIAISAVVIIALVVVFFTRGVNLGIDFAGGSVAQILYKQDSAPIPQIREELSANP